MIVNRIALKRQPTILTLLIIIVIAGAYSYSTLPRESFPDITIPYVFVTTTYEGVSPSDMEELVTIPIERKLKGIADVEEIRSTSAEGISTVAVKFLPSVDIDDALQKVRDRVDQAKNDLPADLKDDPLIKEVNFSDLPVIRVVLSGDFSLRRLQRFAEDLKDKIESIQGVLDAPISGGLEREIHVEFDLDRVGAYNVPFSSLISAVTRSNVNMPGGSMDIGEGKYLVRVPEDFKHPSEIFSIVAFVRDGKPVYLRDLALITDSHKDPLTRTRINGKRSVTIAVQKRSGENIVRVTDEVKKAVEEMRPLLPPSLGIDLTADMSNDVRLMVADLENNILSGLVLVLAVIFVFIGGQSAVFIALAIPYSMFITFILLMGSGVTMNMVVLFSLILALGMLVDNGIVIVENIYRHIQEGEGRLEAATSATDEVAWPVITSTLTTLGAFFPMIFWPGIMGEFMKYLPITLIMALSASLFVALAINPVLSARYQRVKIKAKRSKKDGLIKRAYLSFLIWALNHRLISVIAAFALLLASVTAYGAFGRGTEFFPETEPRRAYINIKAPEGTNLDASDVIVSQVERTAAQYEDIHYTIATVGTVGGDPFSQGGTGTHINRVVIDFKDFHERQRPSSGIVDELRTRLLREIRGAEVQVEKEKEGPPTGPPVNLEISGKDILVLGELAQRARKIMEQISGIVDLKDNFVRGKPEIKVRIDKEKAALFNLDTLTIATTVKSAINGAKVGVFREGKDEYDIIAKLPEKDRRSIESIKRLTISGPAGEPVPITSVADIGISSGLGAIMRLDQKRVVTVSANVSGRLANDAIRDIEKRLVEQVEWPRGYSFRFTGEQREQEKAQAFLIKAFAATLFLIAIILITQFNSVATPLIILTSVLLSLIGVFLGLLVTDTAFGIIMTGIGVISLAGVVVNNAIVLIDYSNQLRDKGLSYRESLIKAGLVRLRPVMLTAITTILGLLPMAAGVSIDFRKLTLEIGSESSQWWGPMAVAVIFGLGVATLLTLVIVPVLCSLADDLRMRFKRPV